MDMKKVVAGVFIVIALFLGYQGFKKYEDNSVSLSIGNLELSARANSSEHWFYFGSAALLLGGGVVLILKK